MNTWKNNNVLTRIRESYFLEDVDDFNTSPERSDIESAWNLIGQNLLDITGSDKTLRDYTLYDPEKGALIFQIEGPNTTEVYSSYVTLFLLPSTSNSKGYWRKNFQDVVLDIIKNKKITIDISCDFGAPAMEDDIEWDVDHFIDVYAKDETSRGYSKEQVTKTKKFLQNFAEYIQPFVDKIKRDAGVLHTDIQEPYVETVLHCGLELVVPCDFGVNSHDPKEIMEKAKNFSRHIIELMEFMKDYM